MNTQDILNIFLILGFLIIVICLSFVSFYFIQALKAIINLAEDLRDTTQNLKNKMGLKVLAAIPAVLIALIGRIIRKRG